MSEIQAIDPKVMYEAENTLVGFVGQVGAHSLLAYVGETKQYTSDAHEYDLFSYGVGDFGEDHWTRVVLSGPQMKQLRETEHQTTEFEALARRPRR